VIFLSQPVEVSIDGYGSGQDINSPTNEKSLEVVEEEETVQVTKEKDIPEELICPITHEIMVDPVVAAGTRYVSCRVFRKKARVTSNKHIQLLYLVAS
jgi:hypothetical protein